MNAEEILSIKPSFLTQKQRQSYFEEGFLLLEKVVPDDWIDQLRKATNQKIEESLALNILFHLGHLF